MTPEEVRKTIVDDHDELRALLDQIEPLARSFEKGGPEMGRELRQRGLGLYARFAAHLDLEDRILAPALRASRADGERRAERLRREHWEQRDLLKYLLGRLSEHERPTLLVAREIGNFAEFLRHEMQHEEETMLSEAVLRAVKKAADG